MLKRERDYVNASTESVSSGVGVNKTLILDIAFQL